jgi:dUTP pyrophosphatase
MSSNQVLKFKKMHETATIPSYATEGSACFDFYSCLYPFKSVKVNNVANGQEEIKIQYNFLLVEPGDRILVPTGICADIPDDYCIKVYSRSGLSFNSGLILTNGVGIIDSDYTEEIFISLLNTSEETVVVHSNSRIAQGELVTSSKINIQEIEASDFSPLPQKTNRKGGFGSTGS